MSRHLVVALAAGTALANRCGGGVDRDRYLERNMALLKSLPTFPGARLARVESAPYTGG